MRTDLPQKQVEEAMKLEARALVELFRISLRPPDKSELELFLSPKKQVVWQGRTWYDDTPCNISEISVNANGETSRPKFSIVNPNRTWSKYAHQKYIDNAIVRRYKIDREDLEDDLNNFGLSQWRVSKVLSVSKHLIVCELRGVLDGHNFKIPSNTFRPPMFPTVSVQ